MDEWWIFFLGFALAWLEKGGKKFDFWKKRWCENHSLKHERKELIAFLYDAFLVLLHSTMASSGSLSSVMTGFAGSSSFTSYTVESSTC